jgi:hypothetical protein
MVETEITVSGIDDRDIEEAKSFFPEFSGEKLWKSHSLVILRRTARADARIYVKGLLIAEEPNFAFSYNPCARR